MPYVVRLNERAINDINAAYVRIAEVVSESVANAWREGLADAMASLSIFPRSHPLASEKFRTEVRQLLYQRPGSQISYRILFTIIEDEGPAHDAPTVLILHIRHAAARPATNDRPLWTFTANTGGPSGFDRRFQAIQRPGPECAIILHVVGGGQLLMVHHALTAPIGFRGDVHRHAAALPPR